MLRFQEAERVVVTGKHQSGCEMKGIQQGEVLACELDELNHGVNPAARWERGIG